MIRLPNLDLSESVQNDLRSYQDKEDAVDDFDERVKRAGELWKRGSEKTRRLFPIIQAVRERLEEMCYRVCACGYCGDNVADQIEHIRPKVFYPAFPSVRRVSWNIYREPVVYDAGG